LSDRPRLIQSVRERGEHACGEVNAHAAASKQQRRFERSWVAACTPKAAE
jgi:hypothetical protein